MFNIFPISSKSFENLDGQAFKGKFIRSNCALLIDVRTPGEFCSGSIGDARNIDFMAAKFKDQFLKLDKEKEYFLFCRSGTRSGQACTMMAKAGYTVYNLDEGIDAWPT